MQTPYVTRFELNGKDKDYRPAALQADKIQEHTLLAIALTLAGGKGREGRGLL